MNSRRLFRITRFAAVGAAAVALPAVWILPDIRRGDLWVYPGIFRVEGKGNSTLTRTVWVYNPSSSTVNCESLPACRCEKLSPLHFELAPHTARALQLSIFQSFLPDGATERDLNIVCTTHTKEWLETLPVILHKLAE